MLRLKLTISLSILLFSQLAIASDSLSIYKKRKVLLGTSSLIITSGSLAYLNQAWYQEYSTSNFHFFNDNEEWYQMDKCGHIYTTYQTGRLMMEAMDCDGFSKKKQLLIGGLSGFAYMSCVEVMDGYSKGWGFSWGDVGSNALGSGLAIAQKVFWDEQRISLKFSFYQSPYAKYRPNLLGKSLSTEILKDYNGQTYWLSVNPSSFIKNRNTKFPKWLNIAIGYGANGMLGARSNDVLLKNEVGNQITFKRYQQGYLSLDIDFTRIKTNSKFLKILFSCINTVKVPFPNLELSKGNLKFNYY